MEHFYGHSLFGWFKGSFFLWKNVQIQKTAQETGNPQGLVSLKTNTHFPEREVSWPKWVFWAVNPPYRRRDWLGQLFQSQAHCRDNRTEKDYPSSIPCPTRTMKNTNPVNKRKKDRTIVVSAILVWTPNMERERVRAGAFKRLYAHISPGYPCPFPWLWDGAVDSNDWCMTSIFHSISSYLSFISSTTMKLKCGYL